MQIEVSVPGLLKEYTGGQTEFSLEAETLDGVLRQMVVHYPDLRGHLYDDGGRLRTHVHIFYNDRSIARLARLDSPLLPGDRVAVVQATSGESDEHD